jgi:hypothetical protein
MLREWNFSIKSIWESVECQLIRMCDCFNSITRGKLHNQFYFQDTFVEGEAWRPPPLPIPSQNPYHLKLFIYWVYSIHRHIPVYYCVIVGLTLNSHSLPNKCRFIFVNNLTIMGPMVGHGSLKTRRFLLKSACVKEGHGHQILPLPKLGKSNGDKLVIHGR